MKFLAIVHEVLGGKYHEWPLDMLLFLFTGTADLGLVAPPVWYKPLLIRFKIQRVSHYASLEEAMTIEGVEQILPGTTSLTAGSMALDVGFDVFFVWEW